MNDTQTCLLPAKLKKKDIFYMQCTICCIFSLQFISASNSCPFLPIFWPWLLEDPQFSTPVTLCGDPTKTIRRRSKLKVTMRNFKAFMRPVHDSSDNYKFPVTVNETFSEKKAIFLFCYYWCPWSGPIRPLNSDETIYLSPYISLYAAHKIDQHAFVEKICCVST